jgi:alcohol dehydrogenase class IV
VVFGAGSVARLGGELDRLGASRAVVSDRTHAEPRRRCSTRDRRAREPMCSEVFAGARQHVPATAVADLVRVLDSARADGW